MIQKVSLYHIVAADVAEEVCSTCYSHRHYRHFPPVPLRNDLVLQQLPGYLFDRLARVHAVAIYLHQHINTHHITRKAERSSDTRMIELVVP